MAVNNMYSALKKCNNIGKKLSLNSDYVICKGMILGYFTDPGDDTTAPGLDASHISVSFMDSTVLKNMGALAGIGLYINGDELYRYIQDYKFNSFMVDDDYVHVVYDRTCVDDSSFLHDFKEHALNLGYNKDKINTSINCNFSDDIDLYDIYLKYKKSYVPTENTIQDHFRMKRLYDCDTNKIISKCNRVIDNLLECEYESEKDISDEVLSKILNSNMPMLMNFNIGNGNIFKLRLMKSLFKTASAKSSANIKILHYRDDIYYVIIAVSTSGFMTYHVYKTLFY